MIYKKFKELNLSALGMGAMRLPTVNGEIDEAATAKMVETAIKNGVNYFDTAWGYHNGKSEIVMGRILSAYPRESYYLATKFPGYDVTNMGKVQEIFEKQLEKCGVEYFDFYLFHNVCELNIDLYLDEKYGVYEYLLKQKAAGRIRHLGFSAHGNVETMTRFLDKYGENMEFCQIQLNYLDYRFQDADKKIELLNSRNIPVWVMEPLRGGKLATLPEKETGKLAALRPGETAVSWAFRFLQSIPGVTVILSGMSNETQIKENIATFACEKPLSKTELDTVLEVAGDLLSNSGVPCTACRYCVTACPQGIDIPKMLSLYNEYKFTGGGFIVAMSLRVTPEGQRPSDCLGCRSCEAVCPQNIRISEAFADFNTGLKK